MTSERISTNVSLGDKTREFTITVEKGLVTAADHESLRTLLGH